MTVAARAKAPGGGCLLAEVPCDRLAVKVGGGHHQDPGGVGSLQGEYREAQRETALA